LLFSGPELQPLGRLLQPLDLPTLLFHARVMGTIFENLSALETSDTFSGLPITYLQVEDFAGHMCVARLLLWQQVYSSTLFSSIGMGAGVFKNCALVITLGKVACMWDLIPDPCQKSVWQK
jgi:hypothetical protein